MAEPSTRARIRALQASLKELGRGELPAWDLGLIYLEVLDSIVAEHAESQLATGAQRPKQNGNRRASVQVGAMLAVLDQLILLYPAPAPRIAPRNGPDWTNREW